MRIVKYSVDIAGVVDCCGALHVSKIGISYNSINKTDYYWFCFPLDGILQV